jgi:hypothetical protein
MSIIVYAYEPACATVTVCPATRTVPDRAVPGLGLTSNLNGLSPLPGLPEVMRIHDAEGSGVHGQPSEQLALIA